MYQYILLHAYKALVILCIDEVTANWNRTLYLILFHPYNIKQDSVN